jgi:hypothetical protein
MVVILGMLLVLTSTVACAEVPVVNLPIELREENWRGPNGEGSCVHATMVMLLRWQQQYQLAGHWRQTYSDGEYADDSWNPGSNLARKFDAENVRYAYTTEGDVEFLKWAIRTRRGAGITVKGGRHMVALVHLDDKTAGLLDNNDITKVIYVDAERLISEWKNSHGWAVTPIYTPAPPLPVRKGK